ncbi:hypothetical protein FA13DRAFT_1799702 [Coprinellus micaceus]|uniref:Uncharacterized protein n=1 Tax=Coprinellus micaceus TaxID=71717 RepID=A0A4Y7SI62_COPMI|nr:hypothetical protein FA13DRAFT_1799702 [Coprinellus micaceus]
MSQLIDQALEQASRETFAEFDENLEKRFAEIQRRTDATVSGLPPILLDPSIGPDICDELRGLVQTLAHRGIIWSKEEPEEAGEKMESGLERILALYHDIPYFVGDVQLPIGLRNQRLRDEFWANMRLLHRLQEGGYLAAEEALGPLPPTRAFSILWNIRFRDLILDAASSQERRREVLEKRRRQRVWRHFLAVLDAPNSSIDPCVLGECVCLL